MDTRSKILTPVSALEIAVRPLAIVTGTFDVLRAAHARELEEVRQLSDVLLVIVLAGSGGVLTRRARGEMVAALRAVDFVMAASDVESERVISALQPERLVRMEAEDNRRLQQLRDYARARFAC